VREKALWRLCYETAGRALRCCHAQPLVHYDVEMATQQQDKLRRSAALGHFTRKVATAGHRPARPGWRWFGLAVVALVLGSATAATLTAHW